MIKKGYLYSALVMIVVIGIGAHTPIVHASIAPTVQGSSTTGDNVSLTVTGDPSTTVYLDYINTSGILKTSSIGTTDGNGNFTKTISSATYSIAPNTTYDISISGLRTPLSTWPYSGNLAATSGIVFYPSSLTLDVGQTTAVNIGGNGSSYLLSGNSSATVASVSLSNNQLIITGNSYGAVSVTVCTMVNYTCSTLAITVSNGTQGGTPTFSTSSPSLTYPQSTTVTISGGTGNYTVASNSDSGLVGTSISGSTITLTALANSSGSSTISICSTNTNFCGTLTVTVTNNSAIGLAQSAITLYPGQTYTIGISGTGSYNITSNTNSNVATASISGNSVVGTGIATGTASILICQASSGCAPLLITVSGTALPTNSVVQITENISVGQTHTITLSGGNTPYHLSTSASIAAVSSLSDNKIILTGLASGYTQVVVCTTTPVCTTIGVNVTGTGNTSSTVSTPSTSGGYVFTLPLKLNMKNKDVTALQQKLTALGFYNGPINGSFGPLTSAGVKKFQKNKGLTADGAVGPGTRALLNK